MGVKSGITPKLISIVSLIMFITAVIMIVRNPISIGELSIYDSLFPLTIVLLVLPIIGGISLVIYGLYKNDNYWQLGLFLILLGNLVIVLLPYLKGYLFSDGGDHLTHLGFAKDILNTGYFSNSDIYPVTHILIAQFSLILNITPETLINFMGPLFYLLFVLFTYLCAMAILSKRAAILAAVASTVLFCYYYNEVFPMGFALIFFPLIFYLYFHHLKTKSARITAFLIILVVLMVFFHPVTSFLLTAALLLMEVANLIYSRLLNGEKEPGAFTAGLPMISFYALILWIWYRFYVWNSAVSSVAGWFHSELFVQPMTAFAQESFNKLGLSIFQQLLLIIQTYGHITVFLGLSIFTILLMIKNRAVSGREDNREIFAYSYFFLPAVAIWLIDSVRPLTALSSGRMVWIVATILPILTGIALNRLGVTAINGGERIKKSLFTITRVAGVGSIIAICSLIGIFSLYPSPYIYQPFEGVSNASFIGEAWPVQEGNSQMSVLGLYTPPTDRIADALWGTGQGDYPQSDTMTIDFHFGYATHQTLGQSFTADKYLFLVSTNKLLYTELWPQVNRLNLSDFARLEDDPTVGRIYSNGEAQNYYVTGVKENNNQ